MSMNVFLNFKLIHFKFHEYFAYIIDYNLIFSHLFN